MADIYISGPVHRGQYAPGPPIPRWVSQSYETTIKLAREFNVEVNYPILQRDLERADAKSFFESIQKRITESRVVVVVFTGGDVSSGIEATIASTVRKPLMIIAEDLERAPRMLMGLPFIDGAARPNESLEYELRDFFRRNLLRSASA